MLVSSSSPGKVILFGEHFVVKGNMAIAGAIDLRTRVVVKPKSEWPAAVKSKPLMKQILINNNLRAVGDPELSHFAKIPELLVEKFGVDLRPFTAEISGELPVAMGLGSSASSAASLIAALAKFHEIDLSKEELFYLTNEVEKLVHGRPSGIDSAVVVYGGLLAYRKGEAPKRIEVKWDDRYSLVVACTKSKKNTGEVVRSVLELAETFWDVFEPIYQAAERLVARALKLLEDGNLDAIGTLMNVNQGLLYSINVSTLELERLIFLSRELGCVGSKLTGAGRGGCLISLCRGRDDLIDRLRELTDKVFITRLGAPGTEVKILSQ